MWVNFLFLQSAMPSAHLQGVGQVQEAEGKLDQAVATIEEARILLSTTPSLGVENSIHRQTDVQTACERLLEYTYPLARSAGDANNIFQNMVEEFIVEENRNPGVTGSMQNMRAWDISPLIRALKQAERETRGIIMLLAMAHMKDSKN